MRNEMGLAIEQKADPELLSDHSLQIQSFIHGNVQSDSTVTAATHWHCQELA
jgi:hypothetical protein